MGPGLHRSGRLDVVMRIAQQCLEGFRQDLTIDDRRTFFLLMKLCWQAAEEHNVADQGCAFVQTNILSKDRRFLHKRLKTLSQIRRLGRQYSYRYIASGGFRL